MSKRGRPRKNAVGIDVSDAVPVEDNALEPKKDMRRPISGAVYIMYGIVIGISLCLLVAVWARL